MRNLATVLSPPPGTGIFEWLSNSYEEEGLNIPAFGDRTQYSMDYSNNPPVASRTPTAEERFICVSANPGMYAALRPTAPAGLNFSAIKVWVPRYPDTWRRIEPHKIQSVTVTSAQLKELFGS